MFHVRDSQFKPINGATVRVDSENGTATTFGAYFQRYQGDNVSVNVTAPGYARQSFWYVIPWTGGTRVVTMENEKTAAYLSVAVTYMLRLENPLWL